MSLLWTKWMPQCLLGTLSKRTSCEGKGEKWEARGRDRAVHIPKRSARGLCRQITELYREEVSCVRLYKHHLIACDAENVQSQESTARSTATQNPENLLVSSTLLCPERQKGGVMGKKKENIPISLTTSDPCGVSPQLRGRKSSKWKERELLTWMRPSHTRKALKCQNETCVSR